MKFVRWKPPPKRYWPGGHEATAVFVLFRRTKTVRCGDENGTSPPATDDLERAGAPRRLAATLVDEQRGDVETALNA